MPIYLLCGYAAGAEVLSEQYIYLYSLNDRGMINA